MTALPLSLLPDSSTIGPDGRLSIGGCDVAELAAEFGTPLFIYDEATLRARCREAVAAFGPEVAYASKAFLCRAMARLAHEEGMRIDVSTGGEMAVALAADVPADRLVFHGNNKSADELHEAVEVGVGRIVIDSFDEIDRLAVIAKSGMTLPPLLVRVTPGVEAHTHEFISTGQVDSKFGFGWHSGDAARAVRSILDAGWDVRGLHVHIGSQVFAKDSFGRAVEVVAPLVNEFGLAEFVIGGGLGVPYVAGETAPTLMEWAAGIREAAAATGMRAAISAEPGRSIVAQAAITVYTVGTIKAIPGVRTYVSVDGGMSDNPRPVLYGSGYEVFMPSAASAERTRTVTVVGKHCESGDILVRDASVPSQLAVGDLLATPVTGAYGHSMGSNYNLIRRPSVVFADGTRARVVVRRETSEDLLRRDLG